MRSLRLWNDRAEVLVSPEALLSFRLIQGGQAGASFALREGQLQLPGSEMLEGLFYHDMPCCFESLAVRKEGLPEPLLEQVAGAWPAEVDDDQLEMYPQLHYLERRKTGLPWRYERWYSLVGAHLVFESEQYFERSLPQERGRNWARFIVQLRQVANLENVAEGAAPGTRPLLGTGPSGRGTGSSVNAESRLPDSSRE